MITKKVLGIEISNPDKIIYPNQNITKIDIVNYYKAVADYMLPYIKNRLISAIRCHKNISETFFKKHPLISNQHVHTYKYKNEDYFYLNSKEDIIYQTQLGTIEFHFPGFTIKNISQPDYMVFDLDPDEMLSLQKLRQGVRHLKGVLDELNLTSFLKTSGGKGYHIVIPFKTTKNWQSFYSFSKQVAILMQTKWPKLYTTNIRKANRKGKIFIDYLRNDKNSTCIAPYSLRARENAPVSFPIRWCDLDKIKPNQITIKSAVNYLENSIEAWEQFFCIDQHLT